MGTIKSEDSGAVRKATVFHGVKLHSETHISDCLGMSTGKSPRRVEENTPNNPQYPITPPTRHHLYTIHLINELNTVFIVPGIRMSLK